MNIDTRSKGIFVKIINILAFLLPLYKSFFYKIPVKKMYAVSDFEDAHAWYHPLVRSPFSTCTYAPYLITICPSVNTVELIRIMVEGSYVNQ